MEEIIKNESEEKKSVSFIEQKVINDLAEGKNGGRMQTRFPPEPNGPIYIVLSGLVLKSSCNVFNLFIFSFVLKR